MHLEVDRQTDQEILDSILAEIEAVLRDVSAAVEDWLPMREKLDAIISELKTNPPPVDARELEEGLAFLEWMSADHFTYLGYREYELVEVDGEEQMRAITESALGVRRDRSGGELSQSFASLPPEIRRQAGEPTLLLITKANVRATVHRPGYLDHVGIKRFDAEGKVTGERRFLGLYTVGAYSRRPRAIPLLREKVARVMLHAGYPHGSHAAKALINILETFPRDLLFQISDDELYATAMGPIPASCICPGTVSIPRSVWRSRIFSRTTWGGTISSSTCASRNPCSRAFTSSYACHRVSRQTSMCRKSRRVCAKSPVTGGTISAVRCSIIAAKSGA
jgi:glutamate dehydrogenase